MHGNYSVKGPGPYAGRTLTYWLWFAAIAIVVAAAFIVIANHQDYGWIPDDISQFLTDIGLDGT